MRLHCRFCVLAVEHEDGSGSYACTQTGEEILYHHPPPDLPYERDPVMRFRAPFLARRMREMDVVLDMLASVGDRRRAEKVCEKDCGGTPR